MNIIRRTVLTSLALIAAAALVACGGSSSMLTGASSMGATIRGTVNGGAHAASHGQVQAQSGSSGITITVVQTGQSTMTDSSGQFVLNGVPSGTVTLHFTGKGIDAQLEVSGLQVGQTMTITVQASGSSAHMGDDNDNNGDNNGDDNDGDNDGNGGNGNVCPAVGAQAEVEGLVDAKTATSITVNEQGLGDVVCMVSTSTRIRKGDRSLTLDDLAIGSRVHVKGTGLGNSTGACQVDASEIKLQ